MALRLCLLLSACLATSLASAQALRLQDVQRQPAPFLEGVAAGILLHELGHISVASAKGYEVGLQGASIVYPGARMNQADRLQVSAAGYHAQWILAEGILTEHERHPRRRMSPRAAGLVASHILITVVYAAGLKNYPTSDLTGVSGAAGISRDTLALLVLVPAALDAWRLTGKHVPKWVPQISLSLKGAGIAATYTF